MRSSRRTLVLALAAAMLGPGLVPGAAAHAQQAAEQRLSASAGAAAAPVNGGRLAGTDRYATAAGIALESFPSGAPTVYLARGDLPLDALAGGTLTDGPVLLVPACGQVPAAVRGALDALRVREVVALGGPAAVCDTLLQQAAQGDRRTARLAGADRYGTAVAISQRQFAAGAGTVYLASGDEDAPDAVAGGALTDGPILTVPATGAAPAAVRAEIVRLRATRVVALGGTAAVADTVLSDAAAGRQTARLAGADRHATAVAIAAAAFPAGAPSLYLARGDVFIDAVAGGSLRDGPIVLVPRCGSVPPAVRAHIASTMARRVVALGGQSAVCDSLLASAASLVVDLTPLEPTPSTPPGTPDRQDVVVSPLARFPDPAAVTAVAGDRIVFDGTVAPDTRALVVGEVLSLQPTELLPHGALRRITAVEVSGTTVTVTTTPATLPDVILAGTIDVSVPLSGDLQPGETVQLDTGQTLTGVGETSYPPLTATAPSGTASLRAASPLTRFHVPSLDRTVAGTLALDYTASRDKEITLEGGTKISGELEVSARLRLRMEVRFDFASLTELSLRNPALVRGEVQTVDADVVLDERVGLTATWARGVSGNKEMQLGRPIDLGTKVVVIGPVVVPFTTALKLTAGASWSAQATATVGVEQTFTQTVGLSYRRAGGWTRRSSRTEPTFSEPTGSVQTTLKADAFVRAELEALAWDALGPTAAVKAFAAADYTWSTNPADRTGTIDIGLEPQVGMQASVPLFGAEAGSVDFSPLGQFRRNIYTYRPTPDQNAGTGDLQFTLQWANGDDLDLHVVDTAGEEIFYLHPRSQTGGELDVDANAGCSNDGTPGGLENVFWPRYSAPPGVYTVSVDQFRLCSGQAPPYRITARVNGVVVLDETGTAERSWTVTVPPS